MAKKKKTRKRAVSKKKPARRKRTRGSSLAAASTADIQKELERRERLLGKLEDSRDQLLDELDKVEKELKVLAKSMPRGGRQGKATTRRATGRKTTGRKRPKNKTNLVVALSKVLKGKIMGVSVVTVAVQKAGYKTSSPNFRTIVNQTLINNKKVFKKVSRGKYTAK